MKTLRIKEATEIKGNSYMPIFHNSFDEVLSFDNISDVTFFETEIKKERDEIMALFPKSYKCLFSYGYRELHNGKIDWDRKYYSLHFEFSVYLDKVTGERNESAEARRKKVIKKVKEFLAS